ncbi:MAG: bacillithiol biosynthesis cysteine-adding enzyme BshC [Raineya sp.]
MLKKQETYPLQALPFFSSIFLDYILGKEPLGDFYLHRAEIKSFEYVLQNKSFPNENRSILQNVLQEQYQDLNKNSKVIQNIHLLSQTNTFTVTTAHQPSIFFGELYFVFKTLSTIRLAEQLQRQYPNFHFVPVFWLGSEDHDFAEISRFRLFGKQYQWQQQEQGAVGRMNPKELGRILEEIPEKEIIFQQAYQKNTLAKATQYALNAFFGEKGLLVIDGDCRKLKKLFAPIIQDELLQSNTFEIIEQTNTQLAALGYKAQAKPRPINLFYLDEQLRKRIVKNENNFEVLETKKVFSKKEIHQEIAEYPERFSPNALLRPIYQEVVLPNLAYIGGPGELAYWLQLKRTFQYFSSIIPYLQMPVLVPRYFGAILQKNQIEKMEKLQVTFSDLWQDADLLRKKYITTHSDKELSLYKEIKKLEDVFKEIKQKATEIDKSLEASVAAEWQKIIKNLENLEKRIQKAEERKKEQEIMQILALKEKIFPEGKLQERQDNFLNFYLNYPTFLEDLYQNIQAFKFDFEVLAIE